MPVIRPGLPPWALPRSHTCNTLIRAFVSPKEPTQASVSVQSLVSFACGLEVFEGKEVMARMK